MNKDLALPTCYGTQFPSFHSSIKMVDCEIALLSQTKAGNLAPFKTKSFQTPRT